MSRTKIFTNSIVFVLALSSVVVSSLNANTIDLIIYTNSGSIVNVGGRSYELPRNSNQIVIPLDIDRIIEQNLSVRISQPGFMPFHTQITASSINNTGIIEINKRLRPSKQATTQFNTNHTIYILLTLFLGSIVVLVVKQRHLFAFIIDPKSIFHWLQLKLQHKNTTSSSQSNFKKPLNNNTEKNSDTKYVINSTFDKYKLVKKIGSGGVSQIFEAIDPNGNSVAIKIMSAYLDDHDMVQKFIAEGILLSSINSKFPDAPIVKVYDYGRENSDQNNVPFIVLELIEGQSLSNIIGRGIISIEMIKNIILLLLDALDAVHATGVQHRDLAPDNIIVTNTNHFGIKLIDFGVAKHEIAWLQGTSYGAAYGKPEYMSPEQFDSSEKQDYRSDYYSLGIILYSLIVGKPPFSDKNIYKVSDLHRTAPLPDLPNSVPDNFKALVMSLLQKKPANRPVSTNEIRKYLT